MHQAYEGSASSSVMRLEDLGYAGGKLTYRSRHAHEPEWVLPTYLDDARRIFDAAKAEPCKAAQRTVSADFEHLRWFPLPEEIVNA